MSMTCPCPCKSICKRFGPIVWAQIAIGYRIENLQAEQHEFVIDLIRQYYFKNELFFQIFGFIEDNESVEEFIRHLHKIMNNNSSLVLIDEHANSIVGICLLSIVNKMDFGRAFSYSNLHRGRIYENYIEFKNSMQRKLDYYCDYKADSLLRYYLLCISDEHRGKQLGFYLLRAGFELARYLHIPIATGVFTSHHCQRLAERVGFKMVESINYNDWTSKSGILFKLPDRETSIALMVAKIPAYYETPIILLDTSYKKGDKKDKIAKGNGKKTNKK